MKNLCKTCYTLISVPLSSISSPSVVDQQVEGEPLLAIGVDKAVYACWLCKIKRAGDDDVSSRNLFPGCKGREAD